MAGMKRQADSPFGTPDSKKGAFSSSGCVLRPSPLSVHTTSITNSPFSQVSGLTMKTASSSGTSPFVLKPATLQAPSTAISSKLKHSDKIDADDDDDDDRTTDFDNDDFTRNETDTTEQTHSDDKQTLLLPGSVEASSGGKTENKEQSPKHAVTQPQAPSILATAKIPTSATTETKSSSVDNPFLLMDGNDQSFLAAGRVFGQNIEASVKSGPTGFDILKRNLKTPVKSDVEPAASKPATFVFGKNMCERVVKSPEAPHHSKIAEVEPEEPKWNDKEPTLNNSELSFSQQAKEIDTQKPTVVEKEPDEDLGDKPTATLAESAIAYEKSHVHTVSLDEVPIVTGEESERNVMQVSGKLYIFETETQLWSERGRGVLRLNDIGKEHPLQSRVVMRTQGCLRVILNSKLFAKMTVEQVGKKSIRFSAMSDDVLKVYLLMTNQMDSSKLFSALDYRISNLRQWHHDTDDGASEEHSGLSARVWDDDSPLTETSLSASSCSDKDTTTGDRERQSADSSSSSTVTNNKPPLVNTADDAVKHDTSHQRRDARNGDDFNNFPSEDASINSD